MRLYEFIILKTKDGKDYERKFVFAANQREAKQKAKKYVSIYRERNSLPFARVDSQRFWGANCRTYEHVFKNWDGSIHADEDGVITIGKALL